MNKNTLKLFALRKALKVMQKNDVPSSQQFAIKQNIVSTVYIA